MIRISLDSILLRKPYLELITDDLYKISERIKNIESGYFIVRNRKNGNYEVHSLFNNGTNTYCFTVPYDELDSRTLDYCLETNLAIHGDEIYKRIEENNAKLDAEKERDYNRNLHDAGLETAEKVAYGIDQDELHIGYKKSFNVGGAVNESG